jgi:ribulose-phosphate 3-epimerase
MLEIIPAINAEDWETVKNRINLIAPYTEWLHLDVADGKFTRNITWGNAEDLRREGPKNIRFEAHLMVVEPEKQLEPWIKAGIRRIILHWEALKPKGFWPRNVKKRIEAIGETLHENWVEFGLAILYRSQPEDIRPFINLLDMVQVLAVEPGLAGQSFQPQALEVVREVKRMIYAIKPEVKIEVDGGVNATNIKECYLVGANIVAAASAIFGAREPHLALENLKRSVLG